MEIKAALNKPFEEKERMDFIVEQNHKNGYEIKETDKALEAWGFTKEEIKEAEKREKEEHRNSLFLTGADVERGIYKARKMDFDDLIELVSKDPSAKVDIKALKIELKANNFYRINPYVDVIGNLLGFTSAQLDAFFEDGDYRHLL